MINYVIYWYVEPLSRTKNIFSKIIPHKDEDMANKHLPFFYPPSQKKRLLVRKIKMACYVTP